MSNPFVEGQAVFGSQYCGREELQEAVLSGCRRVWSVLGLRRFGKTSFLHQLRHTCQARKLPFQPHFWDLHSLTTFDEYAAALADPLHDDPALAARTGLSRAELRRLSGSGDVLELLQVLLNTARQSECALLLLIDEAESLVLLARDRPREFAALRRFLLNRDGVVTVITGSRFLAELDDTAAPVGSAASSGFTPFHWLPPLPATSIRHWAQPHLPHLCEEDWENLCRRTHGHPYFIQALCSRLHASRGPVNEACDALLRGEGLVESRHGPEAFGHDYAYLTPLEQRLLQALLRGGTLPAPLPQTELSASADIVEPLLGGLVRSCYVRDDPEGYSLGNDFFAHWLRTQTAQKLAQAKSLVSESALQQVTARSAPGDGLWEAGQLTGEGFDRLHRALLRAFPARISRFRESFGFGLRNPL